MSRKIKIFLALVVIVAAGYAAGSKLGVSSNGGIPPEFKDARYQGAVIGQDIVNISNGMTADLERIQKMDEEGDYTGALNLTAELLNRTQDVKDRAIGLSAQLEKMTGSLASIKSPTARQAALESITNRLALIGRLLSYSDYLSQLLAGLNQKFQGVPPQKDQVRTLIFQINAEVTAINNFNKQAGQAMDRFDAIIKDN